MNQEINNIPEEALKDDEDLVKFLRGELSANEETTFMQKLQQNPDLKARAIAVARLIKGLERKGVADDESLKSAFKNLSIDDVKNISKPTTKIVNFKKIAAWVMSAAAVLILVFGLRIFYVNSSYEKIAAEYENVFPYSEFSRGSDDDIKEKLNILCNNVLQDKDLKTTIESLNQIFDKSQEENFNECTNYFVVSGWYLSLAHLKNHDPEKAKSVLEKLAKNSDDNPAVSEKAKEVLEKLK
jgi:hypothetical protein